PGLRSRRRIVRDATRQYQRWIVTVDGRCRCPLLGGGWRQWLAVLFGEECFEHVFRDRRGPGAAMTAVFHEHDAGNLRVVAGREEDEPAVVAQVLRRLALRGL